MNRNRCGDRYRPARMTATTAPSVTSVTPDGGSASAVTADDATVVTGSYGTLTLEADGSYSYVLDTTNPAVQSLDDGESLAD
ncbi:MAG: VCBS domain-containing protein, partial [Alphaproteobacteria bacterium]